MGEEEKKLGSFYLELCEKLTMYQLDKLVEALSEASDSKLFNVYGGVSIGVDIINTTKDLKSLIESAKKYSKADETEKSRIVAQNLSTFLSLGSTATGYSSVASHFSLMFDVASTCLNKGLEIVNKRVQYLQQYIDLLDECLYDENYSKLNINRFLINGTDEDIENLQYVLDALQQIEKGAEVLGLNTSTISANITLANEVCQKCNQMSNEIVQRINEKTGQKYTDVDKIADSEIENAKNQTGTAKNTKVDPLILDLSGDGFNIEKKKNGTYFDLNCNGFAERINWTRSDAILTLDKNNNGKIDDGSEVFGNYHLLADGTRAKNGFEALAQYDTNGDGIIDANDEVFDQLKLWVDADGDGISTEGELKTLKEMHIKAIHLNYEYVNEATDTEALIGNVAAFEYEDGTESRIGEMLVSSDLYDAIETVTASVSEAVEGLPNVRSYGTVKSLHNAIALDKTGELLKLVSSFAEETGNVERLQIKSAI